MSQNTTGSPLSFIESVEPGLRGIVGSTGDCLLVLSYYPIAGNTYDQGGGVFYWTSDTTSPENYGTVIVPTATPRTGCWKRQVGDGKLHVGWFGAKGDGKGNGLDGDTCALQRAIDALSNYGTLVFAPGEYPVCNGLSVRNKVYIRIEGNGAIIMALDTSDWNTAAEKALLDLSGTGYAVVDRLLLRTPTTATHYPAAALVIGRLQGGSWSGGHRFINCSFAGKFSVACVYNIGSEILLFLGCDFSAYVSPAYYDSQVDSYGLTGMRSAPSSVFKTFIACALFSFWGDSGKCIVQLPGSSSELTFTDCYFYLTSPGGTVFDQSGTSMYNLLLKSIRVEGAQTAGARLLVCTGTLDRLAVEKLTWTIESDYVFEVQGVLNYADVDCTRKGYESKAIIVKKGATLRLSRLRVPPESIYVEQGGLTGINFIETIATETGQFGHPYSPFAPGSVYPTYTLKQDTIVDVVGPSDTWRSLPNVRREETVWQNNATPSAAGLSVASEESTVGTTITNILGTKVPGQTLTILFKNANTSVASNSNVRLAGNAAWNGIPAGSTLTLIYENRAVGIYLWREIARTIG